MKYCVECGAALPARGPHCLLCQAPVAQAALPARTPPTPPTPPAPVAQPAHPQRALPAPRRLPERPYSRSRRSSGKDKLAWGCLPLIVAIVLLLGFGLFQLIGPALQALAPLPSPTAGVTETTLVAVARVEITAVAALEPTTTLVPRATVRPTAVRPSPTMAPTAILPAPVTVFPTTTSMPPTATRRSTPALLPQVEQYVQAGDVRYTVLQIEADGQQIDSPTSSYTTEGMYVRVSIQTENTGSEVQTAFYPNLIDSQQRLFTPFTSVAARGFVPGDERCTELMTLSPNAPVVCQFIYEVPLDATGFRLRTVPYIEPAAALPTRVAPTRTVVAATPTHMAPTSTVAAATPTVASGSRIGAVCGDGSHTKATGKSACAQHGGVNHWILAP